MASKSGRTPNLSEEKSFGGRIVKDVFRLKSQKRYKKGSLSLEI